jgi:hypothetical protein
MTKKLLQVGDGYRWQLDGITFAIPERISAPEDFIGRVEEMEFLYAWANRVQRGLSKGLAFLGRRKVGKTLMLERLYNILYSEHKGLIPFYYEFVEGERSGKKFYHDFVTRFYMQVVGYYVRDVTWIRDAVAKEKSQVAIPALIEKIRPLDFPHKEKIISRLTSAAHLLDQDDDPYEYIISGVAMPHSFATMVGVEERVVQMLDEFQNLNLYIDAGTEDKPSKAYLSTAESHVAPLLITGSLMGVVSEELMRWLPMRFWKNIVPKMKAAEAQAMTLNYGRLYGHTITPELAAYIVYVTNGIPGRIIGLLVPKIGKPLIASRDDVDQALEFEVSVDGTIKDDWDEYLALAMDAVNDINMRRITYFLCKHEGTWYYPSELKAAMGLEMDTPQLQQELDLLYKYDIIDLRDGRYGGIFDRTLKKVLMKNYSDLFGLPDEEFDAYFKNDNMLDYLQERVEQLELSLAEARELRQTLARLRSAHNNLKGHDYERQVLLTLLMCIIDNKGGIVTDIDVTDFEATLNYHLASGEELDIVLTGKRVVIMVECKHYAPDRLDQLTRAMVDDFITKARRLHQARFAEKELRLGFFSKHGFEPALRAYLGERGVWTTAEALARG